eukprot:700512-Rhodomonas_salina.3
MDQTGKVAALSARALHGADTAHAGSCLHGRYCKHVRSYEAATRCPELTARAGGAALRHDGQVAHLQRCHLP